METEEVKALNFSKMLAFAKFEVETILDDLKFAEVQECMEMLPDGGLKRTAKHRSRTTVSSGRVDVGRIAKGAVRFEERGLRGHRYTKPRSKQREVIVKVDPNAKRLAALASLSSGMTSGETD